MAFIVKFKDKKGGRGIALVVFTPDKKTAESFMKKIQIEYIYPLYGPFQISKEEIAITSDEYQKLFKNLTPPLVSTYYGLIRITEKYERPVGTKELAEELKLSRSRTSHYLKKLVNLGYVEKIPNVDKNLPYRCLFTPSKLTSELIKEKSMQLQKKELSPSLARTKHIIENLYKEKKKPVTANEIAEKLKLSLPHVKGNLKILTEQGEVERLLNIDRPKEGLYVYKPKDEDLIS
jgi:Mn-dependent DtxR family transcriptional regulator